MNHAAPTVRAVLFDLDGTLLDTLADLAESTNAALAELGFPGHPQEAYRHFVGDGMEILARRVLPAAQHSPALIERCMATMRARYSERWANKTAPYEGIPALLDTLSGRGLQLTILSNKPDDFTQRMVAHFLPGWSWRLVRGARPDMPPKPDPGGALAIAAQLGLPPRNFLYLGDTNTDMRTAVAGGMYPLGALWGFRDATELIEAGARELLAHPLDLLRLL